MKNCYSIKLCNELASELVAAELAASLSFPAVLTFSGEIGAGKTTFIRAMLRSLGIQGPIKSPTFSLVESYFCQNGEIHHFDLYRIHEETELEYIGFRDYFVKNALCCIEWPERVGNAIPSVDLHCVLAINGSGRLLTLSALTPVGETILTKASYQAHFMSNLQ